MYSSFSQCQIISVEDLRSCVFKMKYLDFLKIRDLFLYSSCREGFPGTGSTCVYMYLVYLFHQSFGQELIKRLNQARFHLKETLSHREKESRQSHANASLQRAQAMAKDILNLSQSDLEEIMSADGDQESMVCDSICMRFYLLYNVL